MSTPTIYRDAHNPITAVVEELADTDDYAVRMQVLTAALASFDHEHLFTSLKDASE